MEHARNLVPKVDVVWAGDWPEDPGDDEILARAHAEDRVLVTLDKDFGELAVVRGFRITSIGIPFSVWRNSWQNWFQWQSWPTVLTRSACVVMTIH